MEHPSPDSPVTVRYLAQVLRVLVAANDMHQSEKQAAILQLIEQMEQDAASHDH